MESFWRPVRSRFLCFELGSRSGQLVKVIEPELAFLGDEAGLLCLSTCLPDNHTICEAFAWYCMATTPPPKSVAWKDAYLCLKHRQPGSGNCPAYWKRGWIIEFLFSERWHNAETCFPLVWNPFHLASMPIGQKCVYFANSKSWRSSLTGDWERPGGRVLWFPMGEWCRSSSPLYFLHLAKGGR